MVQYQNDYSTLRGLLHRKKQNKSRTSSSKATTIHYTWTKQLRRSRKGFTHRGRGAPRLHLSTSELPKVKNSSITPLHQAPGVNMSATKESIASYDSSAERLSTLLYSQILKSIFPYFWLCLHLYNSYPCISFHIPLLLSMKRGLF